MEAEENGGAGSTGGDAPQPRLNPSLSDAQLRPLIGAATAFYERATAGETPDADTVWALLALCGVKIPLARLKEQVAQIAGGSFEATHPSGPPAPRLAFPTTVRERLGRAAHHIWATWQLEEGTAQVAASAQEESLVAPWELLPPEGQEYFRRMGECGLLVLIGETTPPPPEAGGVIDRMAFIDAFTARPPGAWMDTHELIARLGAIALNLPDAVEAAVRAGGERRAIVAAANSLRGAVLRLAQYVGDPTVMQICRYLLADTAEITGM